ncbi:MAG TPA: hypothetical protein VGG73_15225 [Vicinamibacterales bacterium]|jgi:hypothetical protein
MKERRSTVIAMAAFAIAVPCSAGLRATPAVGFAGTTIAMGTFFNKVIPPDFSKSRVISHVWLAGTVTNYESEDPHCMFTRRA